LDFGLQNSRLMVQPLSANPNSRRAKRIMRHENPKSKI